MKNKKNLWRILTLALALVMLFSVVACSNDEDTAATTEAGTDGSTAAPSTEKPTTATTEKPTEKPTTGTTGTQDPPVDPKPDPKVYSGTPDTSWYDATKTEFVLTTADQVIGFFELRSKDTTFEGMTVKMGTDVTFNKGTAAEIKEATEKYGWYVLNSNYLFKGIFDGQGHTFSGFSFIASGSLTRGMFGSLGEGAVIKNLVIKSAYFKGPDDPEKNTFGLLVSRVRGLNTTIANVTVTDLLYEEGANPIDSIGGLVGRVDGDGAITIQNCSVAGTATITGQKLGGMIGAVNSTGSATIIGCRNLADLTASANVGGMVGYKNEKATVNIITSGSFGTLTSADGTASPEIGNIPVEPKSITFTYTEAASDFSTTLPELFKAQGVITLAGADAKGFGIHPLEQTYGDVKITHYYLETSDTEIAKLKLEDGTPAKKSDFYMTWEIDVAVEGDYDICFNLRLKDQKKRENILLVDGKDPIYMSYDLTEYPDDFFKLLGFADAQQNTYVTAKDAWVHLTEGKHTITMKITDETASSFHFRNVYLVKQEPIMVPQFGVENFSSTIPTVFTSIAAIDLDCSTLDAGVESWKDQSATNHRATTTHDVGAPSATGVVKLKIDGYYHYYVEPQFWDYTSHYQMYMRWSVEIPEDGYYDVCFQFRLKNDDQRYTQIQIDDAPVKEQFALTYKVTGNANLKDSVQNSYMTGWSVYLTAGTHTITARMPDYTKGFSAPSDNSCPSFHFRHIYLVKSDIANS